MPAPPDADPVERDLMVSPEDFQWQMADLASRGFRTLTLDEYAHALKHAPSHRAFLLTFDDAYAHVDAIVTPILRHLGWTAVMFAPSSQLGGLNTWDGQYPYLRKLAIASGEQLRAMSDGPWEIASHSLRHVDLSSLPADQCRTELAEARKRLSELTGKPVLDLAYPYGAENYTVRAVAEDAGYRMAFTAGRAALADRFALDRRAIRGTDSQAVFHMKTSAWAEFLYGIADHAPSWARWAVRNLTASASVARS
jgi:peptidoglycan/xylan/chitin deacetylase (PgdA/CDA1 family)